MEYFEKILQLMGILSIPSISWNIFQYRNKKKIDKIELEKEIKLKRIEIDELTDNNEFEDNQNTRPNSIRYKSRDEVIKEDMRIKKRNREMKKLYTELIYLQELNGESSGLVVKESILYKVKKYLKFRNRK